MKWNRAVALVSGIALLVGVMGWATADAVNRIMARPTSVAVVNVGGVFNGMTEKTHVEADLQKKADELEKLKADKSNEIRDLQSELNLLKPNSPEWQAKADSVQQMAFTLKGELEFRAAKLNQQNVMMKESLYRKILDAIAEVAKSEGIDVVLFQENEPNFPPDKPQQVNALVEMRKVLYAADDLNITDKVMAVVNNKFKSGQ